MKVVVLVSGGMDSSTLLHLLAADRSNEVRALGIYYGQRHSKELWCAEHQAKKWKAPYAKVNLSALQSILPGSSQTDSTVLVPEGHYSEESMKATVVPNRNMILLSIAIGHAVAHKFDAVAYAAHAGDHAIYPDCRPEFVEKMQAAAQICDWRPISILRPFINDSKADIVRRGMMAGMDYENTWTCYAGGDVHCGKCGTCVERILAFHEAGFEDSVRYLDKEFAFAADKKFRAGS